MSTLPPPGVKPASPDSLEKKAYDLVEELKDFIPVQNDRNRLGFCLYKYLKGEGDEPIITIKNAKINFEKVSLEDLAKKLEAGLAKIK